MQEPIASSIIDVKKTTAWGESGFPARFLVDYQVATTREGEYVHVTAEADPDNPRTHRWLWRPYATEEGLFTQDTARQFFGVTCGMSERTRNRVVDQIDFTIVEDLDPGHDQVD